MNEDIFNQLNKEYRAIKNINLAIIFLICLSIYSFLLINIILGYMLALFTLFILQYKYNYITKILLKNGK